VIEIKIEKKIDIFPYSIIVSNTYSGSLLHVAESEPRAADRGSRLYAHKKTAE